MQVTLRTIYVDSSGHTKSYDDTVALSSVCNFIEVLLDRAPNHVMTMHFFLSLPNLDRFIPILVSQYNGCNPRLTEREIDVLHQYEDDMRVLDNDLHNSPIVNPL